MSDESLYEWENKDTSDLNNIEKEALNKAIELNDKFLDAKTILDELSYEWKEYMDFLEEERISKICEFYGNDTIPFNEDLLEAIVETLKKSLNNTKDAIDYNSKKIKINQIIKG